MAKASPNNGNESEAEPSKPEEIRDRRLGRNGGKWPLKEEKEGMKGAVRETLRARAIKDSRMREKATHPLANQSLRHSVLVV